MSWADTAKQALADIVEKDWSCGDCGSKKIRFIRIYAEGDRVILTHICCQDCSSDEIEGAEGLLGITLNYEKGD